MPVTRPMPTQATQAQAATQDDEGKTPLSDRDHFLIGVTSEGKSTVLKRWPHIPHMADVEKRMGTAKKDYVAYALCSVAGIHGLKVEKPKPLF